MIAALKPKSNASASVVDGKLILSFPHAQTPVVWQMDLTQAKASALEVLKATKGNNFTLTLKTQKGEKVEIATFDSRDEAIEGLMAASKALENGHGNINIAANDDPRITTVHARKKPSKGKWLMGLLGLLALLFLFTLWGNVSPRTPASVQSSTSTTNSAAQSQNTAAQSSGVPVSADDFLNGL